MNKIAKVQFVGLVTSKTPVVFWRKGWPDINKYLPFIRIERKTKLISKFYDVCKRRSEFVDDFVLEQLSVSGISFACARQKVMVKSRWPFVFQRDYVRKWRWCPNYGHPAVSARNRYNDNMYTPLIFLPVFKFRFCYRSRLLTLTKPITS